MDQIFNFLAPDSPVKQILQISGCKDNEVKSFLVNPWNRLGFLFHMTFSSMLLKRKKCILAILLIYKKTKKVLSFGTTGDWFCFQWNFQDSVLMRVDKAILQDLYVENSFLKKL